MTARKIYWLPFRLALILATLTAACQAAAAPPPLPPPGSGPPGSEGVIDGYRMSILYSVWANWIDRHKADAAKAALAGPETIEGERPWGMPLWATR